MSGTDRTETVDGNGLAHGPGLDRASAACATVPGVTEVNTIGGYEQQFHITPLPGTLTAYGLALGDIAPAL